MLDILYPKPLNLQPALSESEALSKIATMAGKNKVMKSYIGMGYYDTIVPNIILQSMFENPDGIRHIPPTRPRLHRL